MSQKNPEILPQDFRAKKEARDGIRTRDPRLGKAILHH